MNSQNQVIKSKFTNILNWVKAHSTLLLLVVILIMGAFIFRGCGDGEFSDKTERIMAERDSIAAQYERSEQKHISEIAAFADSTRRYKAIVASQSRELAIVRGQLAKEKVNSGSLAQKVRDARNNGDTVAQLIACDSLADQVDKLVASVTRYQVQAEELIATHNTQLALKDKELENEKNYSSGLRVTIEKMTYA